MLVYFCVYKGIEVDRSAYLPKQRTKKRKIDEDSSSDEKWLPGKDENFLLKKVKPSELA